MASLRTSLNCNVQPSCLHKGLTLLPAPLSGYQSTTPTSSFRPLGLSPLPLVYWCSEYNVLKYTSLPFIQSFKYTYKYIFYYRNG